MIYSKELLKKLAAYSGNNADKLADLLHEVQRIQTDIESWDSRLRKAVQNFEAEKAMIEKEKREVQKKCQHWETKYYPDPCRNSDSWTECQICGASV